MTGGDSPRSGNSSPVFGSRSPSPSALAAPSQQQQQQQQHKSIQPSSASAAAQAAGEPQQHVSEPSDVPHLIRTHETLGYRAGLSDGKDHASGVQEAFDQGYPLGAALGFKVGWLLRRLAESGTLSYNGDADFPERDQHNTTSMMQDAVHELSISKLIAEAEELGGLNRIPEPGSSSHEPQQKYVLQAELVERLPAIIKWTKIARES